MTGDTTIQPFIFVIGILVFALAMVGGLLVMKDWYRREQEMPMEQ